MPKLLEGWYHNASYSERTDVEYFEECPRGDWYGPFKTFGKAKLDAIEYHATDRRRAKCAIRLIKLKRPPKKRGETPIGKIFPGPKSHF